MVHVIYHSFNAWLYYLAILSLITIRISDWRHFSDVHISQGSVATRLKRGGIFKYEFVANLLPSRQWKKFKNRLIFGEVMGKSLLSCFFDSRCRDRKEERVVRLINAITDKAVGACVKLIYSRKQANPFDCSWNPALHPHTNPPSIRSMQIWWQGLRELQRPTTIQNDRIRLTALWTTVLSVLIHDEA